MFCAGSNFSEPRIARVPFLHRRVPLVFRSCSSQVPKIGTRVQSCPTLMELKLTLQSQMQHFRERWLTLPDTRKPNNNTQYMVADGVLSAFAVFFMQSSSFLAHQRLLQSKKGRNNARNLFQVTEIPSDAQIRNLVDTLGL
jgi:hypothetical protein